LDLIVVATPEAPVLYRAFESAEDHEKVVIYQAATGELAFLFVSKTR